MAAELLRGGFGFGEGEGGEGPGEEEGEGEGGAMEEEEEEEGEGEEDEVSERALCPCYSALPHYLPLANYSLRSPPRWTKSWRRWSAN